MIRFEVARPPSVNNLYPTGKNGRRFLSPRYKKWRDEAMAEIMVQRIKQLSAISEIKNAYKLRVEISDQPHPRPDLDNCAKAINDLIVKMALVEDDSLCDAVELCWHNQSVGRCTIIVEEA